MAKMTAQASVDVVSRHIHALGLTEENYTLDSITVKFESEEWELHEEIFCLKSHTSIGFRKVIRTQISSTTRLDIDDMRTAFPLSGP